jgi:hypothetical protein
VTLFGFFLGGLGGGAEVGRLDLDATVGGLEEAGEGFEEVTIIADEIGREKDGDSNEAISRRGDAETIQKGCWRGTLDKVI